MRYTLKAQAADIIRSKILSREYAPGTDLSEQFLVDHLGMSRTPVREALLVLQQEGLVQIIPNKGAHVVKLEASDIIHLEQAREALEVMAIHLAIGKIDEAVLHKLLKEIEDELIFVQETDIKIVSNERYQKTNTIHSVIMDAAGNKYITRMYASISAQISRNNTMKRQIRDYKTVLLEHKRIIKALLTHDEEAAIEAIQAHIRTATISLLTAEL